MNRINDFASSKNYPFELVTIGSIFWLSFNGKKRITNSDEINPDMTAFKIIHRELLNRGVYLGPSGYEVGFISQAHDIATLDIAASNFCEALDIVFKD